jgi:hypothetical protein
VFISTPVAPFGGFVKADEGVVLFGPKPVVKELWEDCVITLPAASRTPWTAIV